MRNNCAQKRKCDAGDVHAQRVDGAAIPWTTARVWAAFFFATTSQLRQKFVRTQCVYAVVPVTRACQSPFFAKML